MKTTTMGTWRRLTRGILLASLAVLGLSQAPHAQADMFLKGALAMVGGTADDIYSFNAPSAGTVTATVSDVHWAEGLSALSFAATTAGNVLSSWSVPLGQGQQQWQTESFQVGGAGTYYAHIMATADNSKSAPGFMDYGLYSFSLTFAPVPLPSSEWMLLIGVLVLFGLTRVMGVFGRFEGLRSFGTPSH